MEIILLLNMMKKYVGNYHYLLVSSRRKINKARIILLAPCCAKENVTCNTGMERNR